jgi:hypothetical protein
VARKRDTRLFSLSTTAITWRVSYIPDRLSTHRKRRRYIDPSAGVFKCRKLNPSNNTTCQFSQ